MKIAVVGSGVSGLAATWLLNEHSDHQVHLFEADDRAGGHANTVGCRMRNADVYVDTGFIVFNPTSYPNFLRFLSLYPDITILPTQMTFSVSRDHGVLEWAGCCLAGVFCRPSRLLDPSMWRLLYDILRFNACARELVVGQNSYLESCSVAEYLAQEGYSDTFRDDYLIPMTAAIRSAPPDKCLLDFPARTLIKLLGNHQLLQITGRPSWWTIKGGSHHYVNAILEKLPRSQLHLSTPIASVGNAPDGTIKVTTADGRSFNFDRVIMACHSDVTLGILKAGSGVTAEEEKILGRFTWSRNDVVLHNDVSFMPKSQFIWSSWNYLTFSAIEREGVYKANGDKVSLTCTDSMPSTVIGKDSRPTDNMNLLQHLPTSTYGPVLVTLNPRTDPAAGTVAARFQYNHPVLNAEALVSMRDMGKIQGHRGIVYAGAWLGYGFHEDGFTSGLRAAVHYIDDDGGSVRLPFDIASVDVSVEPVWAARVFDVLERSGMRGVLGRILSFVLALLARLILVGNVSMQKKRL